MAEDVLSGRRKLQPSQNDYDWLGPGIYFWVDSPERGLNWSREQAAKKSHHVKKPDVIGAFIYPGLCLNLTDYGVKSELLDAYSTLSKTLEKAGTAPPKNSTLDNGIFLRRALDCAVIKTVHALRANAGEEPYQTVYGVFEEGAALYPNAGFKAKTHVQLAAIDSDCTLGYFRVRRRRRSYPK